MNITSESKNHWFVGAMWGNVDKSEEFISGGFWENGYAAKYIELVNEMKPGDRIALKAAYTRKHNLPFDNRGNHVSVMSIKAIGEVTENPGDGSHVDVIWTKLDHPKEWYFYTGRLTVWRVSADKSWCAAALIDFTFSGIPQDIDRFRNDPYWLERFGDVENVKRNFRWSGFYQEVANKLLQYKQDRTSLVSAVQSIVNKVLNSNYLTDELEDGKKVPLTDICPFTVFGTFNRGITDKNRIAVAQELAGFLGVDEPVPQTFDGIPILNNQSSWFFSFQKLRGEHDIDRLWEVFEQAIAYADGDSDQEQDRFVSAYENAATVLGVGWNLTMGLFWIRPWDFPTLDSRSREYIKNKLGMSLKTTGEGHRCNSLEYLAMARKLNERFQEDQFSVHSYPELSYASWIYEEPKDLPTEASCVEDEEPTIKYRAYSVQDILDDGCFYPEEKILQILHRLREKKNIILQGPPGTGKTWLAKRLAYALMKKEDPRRLKAVQFHPNLSYEDFIRGYRPNADGRLDLIDGPFLEVIEQAADNPEQVHVVVIEEINRGNPAQIFGEMLTLLESDKRNPAAGLEICYRRSEYETKYIPDNVYLIGTMNIADRSLALVDMAFRRRFAFINLEPTFGNVWRSWVSEKFSIEKPFLKVIERNLQEVNEVIASDDTLGVQFKLGHSYVTPSGIEPISDSLFWFLQIVETELEPILEEYWFDRPDKVKQCSEILRKDIG